MTITRKKFVQWLREQEPGREFVKGCCHGCLIAEYLSDVLGGECHVTEKYYSREGRNRQRLPTWAQRAIRVLDNAATAHITAAQCLELLGEKL